MPDRNDVIQASVKAASAIPEVQLILLVAVSEEAERVLTIIDAPRFSRDIEHRVYDAELQALDLQGEQPLVDFRLWNLRELRGPLENYLSAPRQVLFQREHVA